MRSSLTRIVLTAIPLVALACATGGSGSGDDAASFGPGSNASQSAGSGSETDSGVDTTAASAGSMSMSSTDSADTADPDCQDLDGDNYGEDCAAGPDCDDDDPDVNPGAPETCDGTDENCDEMVDNGCECPDDGVSGNCNQPTDIGMLVVGDAKLGVVGNVPTEDGIDWYTVQYPTMARPGEGTPTIQFAINEGDAFVFDVVAAQCEAAAATCSSGGTEGAAIGLTSWSFVDDVPDCCTPPNDSMVAWPNQLHLRVYRTTTGSSCAAYQLQFSR